MHMISVVKDCDGCGSFDEVIWIPGDAKYESFKCPYCPHGTVSYRKTTEEDLDKMNS